MPKSMNSIIIIIIIIITMEGIEKIKTENYDHKQSEQSCEGASQLKYV